MHFGITEKPTTECVSAYNNAGLISKISEKIASENAENCSSRQRHYRLTSPAQRTSTNIRINLISPETRVIGLHFAADSMGLSSDVYDLLDENCEFFLPHSHLTEPYTHCSGFVALRCVLRKPWGLLEIWFQQEQLQQRFWTRVLGPKIIE